MTRSAIGWIRLGLCFCFCFCSIGPGPAPALAQKNNPDGAKVLLLSGGRREHHGYRDQAFYLTTELENTGRYEVTVTEEAAVLDTPALSKYDLVVAIADRREPGLKLTSAQQHALVGFVKSGKGYVSIHGADNAPADWGPEFKLMLGGVFSHFGLPDGKVRKGDYTVKIVDANDPVGKGISEFPLKDELYYHLQMSPGVKPLAVVDFEGAAWPVAWTRKFGEGRVFHTVFGHRDFGLNKDDPLRNPGFNRLIVQGIDWAAGKR